MKNCICTLLFMLFGLVAFAQKPYVIFEDGDMKKFSETQNIISLRVGNVSDLSKAEEFKAIALSYDGIAKVDYKDVNANGRRPYFIVLKNTKDPLYIQNFLMKLNVEDTYINKELVKTKDLVTFLNNRKKKTDTERKK